MTDAKIAYAAYRIPRQLAPLYLREFSRRQQTGLCLITVYNSAPYAGSNDGFVATQAGVIVRVRNCRRKAPFTGTKRSDGAAATKTRLSNCIIRMDAL